jgi:hypothetical protein
VSFSLSRVAPPISTNYLSYVKPRPRDRVMARRDLLLRARSGRPCPLRQQSSGGRRQNQTRGGPRRHVCASRARVPARPPLLCPLRCEDVTAPSPSSTGEQPPGVVGRDSGGGARTRRCRDRGEVGISDGGGAGDLHPWRLLPPACRGSSTARRNRSASLWSPTRPTSSSSPTGLGAG